MALVSAGFQLAVTLVDQGKGKSTLRYDLTAADAAAAATATAAILAALAAVTDAGIQSYTLGEVFKDAAVGSGSGQVENLAVITAKIDSVDLKYAVVKIPAPADGIFSAAAGAGYDIVDPADADLVAYLQVWQTGNQAYLSDGETLVSPGTAGNVVGKRAHRASKKS